MLTEAKFTIKLSKLSYSQTCSLSFYILLDLCYCRCAGVPGHPAHLDRQLRDRRISDAHHQRGWGPRQHRHGLQVHWYLLYPRTVLYCTVHHSRSGSVPCRNYFS